MHTSTSLRWLVVVVSAAMLLAVAAACGTETVEVPGETVIVEKVVTETVEVPGETVVVKEEVIKTVEVPGETVVKEVVKEVQVPGETVVVEKVVTETVEVPGETVTVEVVKEVMVPGETVVVEKEVVKTIEVPGQTVVVEKVVTETVEVPGETVVVEKEVIKEVQVPGETVVVTKEVPGPERVVVKEVEVEPERYVRNVWGELVDKPQYGGSIPIGVGFTPGNFDPYWDCFGGCRMTSALTYERLGVMDWAVPRDEYDLTSGFPNIEYATGALAESWEQPDLNTTIFHIRPGIHWQDKAPLNGRELTAKDIEFSWHRIMGLGSGYSGKAPGLYFDLPVVSVTATDDWTVEVKASEFRFDTLRQLVISTQMYHTIHATPEVIEQHGDLTDWRNIVGTGPYEVAEYKDGDSLTFARSNNYWGYDPLHPNNRLPYPDEIKFLILPELATQVAALRSSAIALMMLELPYAQIASIQKTNPELVLRKYTGGVAENVGFNMEVKPFDDINVRIAMQKALDNEEIVRNYYGGKADPTPWGVANAASGLNVPFEQWPEDVRWMYEYDPAAAEKLLDDAGLPRGSNGIRFERTWLACYYGDIDAVLLYASYWEEIGVRINLEIPPDESVCWPRLSTRNAQGVRDIEMHMHDSRHKPLDPLTTIAGRYHSTKGWVGENVWGVVDPEFDALVDSAQNTTDWEEYKKKVKAADAYHVAQMWSLYGPPVIDGHLLHAPWLKGYRAEYAASFDVYTSSIPYMWVDQQLKDSMAR